MKQFKTVLQLWLSEFGKLPLSSDSTSGLTPTVTEPMLVLDVNTTTTTTAREEMKTTTLEEDARRRRCDTVLAGGGDAEICESFPKE